MRIIAGPCQHESILHSLMIATWCKDICDKLGIEYYYKASFDKANRSSDNNARGRGLDSTLSAIREVKEKVPGLKFLTDVHSVQDITHIETQYNDVVDVLQIPAFLCRQTDLVKRACETDKIVNIKKGQFLAPWDMTGLMTKTKGAKEVWVTERGTSFGYNTLVNDFTGIRWMLDNLDCPVVMDATHSVQKPGGLGGSSGGNREYAEYQAYAAAAVGVKDFFLEVHENPPTAPSDGPNMIFLTEFERVVTKLKQITELA